MNFIIKKNFYEFNNPIIIYFYLISGVKKNLHIAVLMDFTDPQFLFRCKSNPALYKSCNVLWLDDWSDDSMILVRIFFSINEDTFML